MDTQRAAAPAGPDRTRAPTAWLIPLRALPARLRLTCTGLSFALPLLLWAALSYVPALWHPMVLIDDGGDIDYLRAGQRVERTVFERENARVTGEGLMAASGRPANPVYFPAPHEVAIALYTAFIDEPQRRSEQWLHQYLWSSIQVIALAFLLSSAIGVPLGVLCGSYDLFARLVEPFVEFFRYLPAPAFGALAVAVLGIHQAPKIAIVVIGTLFQQVLVIAATTRKLDRTLIEAAQTLGARRRQLLFRVVIPAVAPDVFRDQRILLGWAWTYLIVAELIGTSSGITWFITQQARYKHYDNVYAAILILGLLGLATDAVLARLGRRLFRWRQVPGV